jgi:Holliday junction DNA helicase RuvA
VIAFIEGTVRQIRSESVVVQTGGIGFEILTPDPAAVSSGRQGLWHIYESIREDGWTLYGFTTEADYQVFLSLIGVKGIGPKSALQILTKAGGRRILEAVEKEDVSALKALPGIGPKTASQMLLDMRGRLVKMRPEAEPAAAGTRQWQETVSALENFGYRSQDIAPLEPELASRELPVQDMIREALRLLAKRKGCSRWKTD